MSKELRKLKYEISLLGHSKEDLIGVTMRLEELESKLKEAEEEVECCNCGNEIVEYKHLAFGLCEECRKRTI